MLNPVLRLQDNQQERILPQLPDETTYDALAAVLRMTLDATPIGRALASQSIDPWVSLWFLDDPEMEELNHLERNISQTTDVLSFPMAELEEGQMPEAWDELPTEPPMELPGPYRWEIGTIAISLPKVQAQAEALGHHPLRELSFLVAHGMLHLLGFDHEHDDGMESDPTWQAMETLQTQILDGLGLTRDVDATWTLPESFEDLDVEFEEEWMTTEAFAINYLTDRDEPQENQGLEISEEPLPEGFVSGFVALLGRTNAGKSTLINRLSGMKVAITSHKSQTTRSTIRAIINRDDAQLIFTDTPGLFKPNNKLGTYMRDVALSALRDADVGLLLVDAERAFITDIEKICCEEAQKLGKSLILVLTKIDQVDKEALLPVINRYTRFFAFDAIVPISALKDDGIEQLVEEIKRQLPEGPRYYDPTASTDQTERSLTAELIREQILTYMHQEIPHGTAVQIDRFEELDREGEVTLDPDQRTLVRIEASILCDRDSHKGMIIGQQGRTLKRIGSSARVAIEHMLDSKVYLDLHVKVRENWRNRDGLLKDLGYSKDSDPERGLRP